MDNSSGILKMLYQIKMILMEKIVIENILKCKTGTNGECLHKCVVGKEENGVVIQAVWQQ